nr:MAG TPA: hypothetical protein [Caudoviricetes sp.]
MVQLPTLSFIKQLHYNNTYLFPYISLYKTII